MITLDEAIAHEKEVAEKNRSEYEFECSYYGKETVDNGEKLDCVKCAEEHEQLAEWLEELKAYRTLDKTNFSDGYNKAIDDFMKRIDEEMPCDICDGAEALFYVEDIAKQLKEGGTE